MWLGLAEVYSKYLIHFARSSASTFSLRNYIVVISYSIGEMETASNSFLSGIRFSAKTALTVRNISIS